MYGIVTMPPRDHPCCPSLLADCLLAAAPQDPERPFYREDTFRSKERLSRRREPRLGLCAIARPESPLAQAELEGLLSHARLTETQERVVRLRVAGWTYDEIGEARGCSKQAAQRLWSKAAARLRRALETYRFAGLADVYRAETSRRGPRRRDR
ncbi:MAG: hypothetical protein N2109_12320 [Fimbriimonadales bacterium]|nr:hypothetical protein [Fimbriimonadales bacterium]